MGKDSNLFSGQPSFKQIASLLDKAEIAQIANDARPNRYVKKLDAYSHLVPGCLVDAGKRNGGIKVHSLPCPP